MDFPTKEISMSDDEDDLELLRLAALQTIKKPPVINNIPQQPPPPIFNKIRRSPHRGRTHYSGPGRGGRGGQFNGRSRNTNLISIPTVESGDLSSGQERLNFKADITPAPKLVLPQDRYCNKTEEQNKLKEISSKFSRYDHSDKSDSEEESASESSGCDEPGKLERANSLEALMQELEYEISGEKPKDTEKLKVKKRKAKRQVSENEAAEEKLKEETNPVENKDKAEERLEERAPTEVTRVEEMPEKKVEPLPPVHRKWSPLNGSRKHNRQFHRPRRNGFVPNYSEPPPNFPYAYPPNRSYMPPNPYPPPHLPPMHPPNYITHRPLSPLNLNTEVLSTIAMAPLSPRSAAFVLQNREIIERRRKSPRRSFSRSPSPRFRRSKSPRRSPIPRLYTRSVSPKRSSPIRRVTRNTPPRKASPLRPAKVSTPERKESPKTRKTSPKPSIKDRLGVGRTHKPEEVNVKVEDGKVIKTEVEIPQPVDSVLEARKRKFEEKVEVTAKEGIIRLKPKTEETPEEECQDDTDDLLDLDTNDTIVDNLFSDEESDNENEGRFKLSSTNKREATTLPFAQLSNRDRDLLKLSLDETRKDHHCRRERDHHSRDRRRRKRTSTPPRTNSSKIRKSDEEKVTIKSRDAPKREHNNGVLEVDNKKVKVESKSHGSENKDAIKKEHSVRKVAIAKSTKENDVRIQDEPEVIIDEEDNDITVKSEAGDLRAQLSRKRAERQHKLPVAEDVQSRLLQNALEGAVFKKSRKLKKEKEAAPKDKVPIHMRLGLAKETDKVKETKRRKKKARSSEQV